MRRTGGENKMLLTSHGDLPLSNALLGPFWHWFPDPGKLDAREQASRGRQEGGTGWPAGRGTFQDGLWTAQGANTLQERCVGPDPVAGARCLGRDLQHWCPERAVPALECHHWTHGVCYQKIHGLPGAVPADGREVLHGGTQGHLLRLHGPAGRCAPRAPQGRPQGGGPQGSRCPELAGGVHAPHGDDQQLLTAALPPRGGLPGVHGCGHEVLRSCGHGDPVPPL